MTHRELMQAVLAGERLDGTPQWLMAFSNTPLMRRLIPPQLHYDGYGEYPEEGAYPFAAMGKERLQKEAQFNAHIDRCAFPVGWGANAAFGHGGPGEFNKTVIQKEQNSFIVRYETGVKREIRLRPHNVRIYDHPIQTEADLENLILPDPKDPSRYAGLAEDIAWAKSHGEWTAAWLNGFFSGVHYFLREFTEFFADLKANPDLTRAMVDRLGNWNLAAAQKLCEAGVDCIGFCDDLGSGKWPLISPRMYREFFWPWHKLLCDLAHRYGAVVHMHSHGAIMPLLADITSTGVDILNPLDPAENMALAEARQVLGPKVTLCGGLDKHFFDWTQDEQASHLRAVVQKGRECWPHILMDPAGILDHVTRERFDWFLATSREIRSGG